MVMPSKKWKYVLSGTGYVVLDEGFIEANSYEQALTELPKLQNWPRAEAFNLEEA